jgi:hypothetical protein
MERCLPRLHFCYASRESLCRERIDWLRDETPNFENPSVKFVAFVAHGAAVMNWREPANTLSHR